MKKSRFSEHQIITILKSGEAGRTAKDVCREHGISSATFYAWKSKFGGMEASDIKRMRDLEHENVRLKQMYAELSLENRPLKDVIEKSSEANRIYRQLQLNMRRKGKRRLPSRAPVRLEAQTVVNGCWSVDFMGDALMHGQRFRTFNVLDDFSREVLAVEVDTNVPTARIIRVFDRIAAWRGYPTKMRMDNGPEFVSAQLAGWAEQHGIDLEFTQPGKPTQNPYVERFNRIFREEVLNFYVFSRLSEVRTIVDAWVQDYNEQRPHESLGNFTPEEFALNMPGAPA